MAEDTENYYKTFGITPIKNKEWLKKQKLYNIFKKPIKDKHPGKFLVFAKDYNQQADLLFLPNDGGYKYALVVTDIATRISDAEPLKSKQSEYVMKAFKKIYNRDILSIPDKIDVDSGKEFQGSVRKFFDDNDTFVKVALPGRHRQLAMVERTNQYLARALFLRMYSQEFLTGKTETGWVDDLPIMITALNKQRGIKPRNPPKLPECEGDNCKLLEIGTKVRVQLDNPKEYVTGEKLHGKFRSTDMRYDPAIRKVMEYSILPGQPPMYFLSYPDEDEIDMRAMYTKAQLQVVPKNEQLPPNSVLRKKKKNKK